jgi:hypothetical protein
MNASMERIFEITRERIAASQEEAVRALVRSNAMLEDEVEMLQAEVHRLQAILGGQNPECPCEGCVSWDDWGVGNPATRCEDANTPDPWYAAAADGGVSGCPNYTPERAHNPIKVAIEIELLRFKDGIRHIDKSFEERTISREGAHRLKNKLAGVYAAYIARTLEENDG